MLKSCLEKLDFQASLLLLMFRQIDFKFFLCYIFYCCYTGKVKSQLMRTIKERAKTSVSYLTLSFGLYFKWATHDDLFTPEFLERCTEIFDHNTFFILCSLEYQRLLRKRSLLNLANLLIRREDLYGYYLSRY